MMRNVLITVVSVFAFAALVGGGVWWVQALTAATGLAVLSLVVFLYHRFTRASPDGPWACRVAAALAVTIGVANVITGVAHSMAVASLALREPGYGPLQILRFTTGAMLVYSGAMNIAVYRGIRDGRGWAIGVGVSSGLLFCFYLMFTLPLPGTGGSVPRELVLWTFYLGWLGAAAVASLRAHHNVPIALAVIGS
jgi:hypothetical protein